MTTVMSKILSIYIYILFARTKYSYHANTDKNQNVEMDIILNKTIIVIIINGK